MDKPIKYAIKNNIPSYLLWIVFASFILIILGVFLFKLPLISMISIVPLPLLVLIVAYATKKWCLICNNKIEYWSHPDGKGKKKEWSLNYDQIESVDYDQKKITLKDIHGHAYSINVDEDCYKTLKAKMNFSLEKED